MNVAEAEKRFRLAERRLKDAQEEKLLAHARGVSISQEHLQVYTDCFSTLD